MSTTYDDLIRRVKTLSERLWEGNGQEPDIRAWLSNFDGRHARTPEIEHLHALHLLSSVSYFGLREMRVLLKALFRDKFRYPIVQQIRQDLGGARDENEIHRQFAAELAATRFIGMGNPAESGTHLLYYFRQENQLSRALFVHQHELLTSAVTDPSVDFADPNLKRVVFIDDLCGSGEQSVLYSKTLLRDLKHVASLKGRSIQFQYLVVFGMASGLAVAARDSDFDVIDAVCELDGTYLTYGPDSRVFRRPPNGIDKVVSQQFATGYGAELVPRWPLGYANGQLLLAFHHNVPDNSLPILWYEEGDKPWVAAFRRHLKIN